MIVTNWSSKEDNDASKREDLTWGELVARLQTVRRHGPAWSAAIFKPPTRHKDNVTAVTAFVFDVDKGTIDKETIERACSGIDAVAHSTKSHKVRQPRWRIVIRASREILPIEYPALWLSFEAHFLAFGIVVDPSAKDVSRLWFYPSNPPGAQFVSFVMMGQAWDVDAMIAKAPKPPAPESSPVAPGAPRPAETTEAATYRKTSYLKTVLESACMKIARAGEGERNSLLFATSCTVFAWFTKNGFAPDVPWQDLREAARECGMATAEIESVLRKALDQSGRDPKLYIVPDRPKPAATGATLAASPPAAYPLDWDAKHEAAKAASGGDAEELTLMSSDVHHAELFVEMFGHDVRYVTTWKRWLVWNGKFWSTDETQATIQLAVTATKRIAAKEMAEGKELKDIANLQSHRTIRAIISIASSHKSVAVHHNSLDADPHLLNCTNGTLNLLNGTLQKFSRNDMITKTASVAFDKDAKCPRWNLFLDQAMVGRKDLIQFLQCYVGYSLSGYINDQSIVFLNGGGNNGKSTFMSTIADMLGGYVAFLPRDTLNIKKGDSHPTALTALVGARLAIAPEVQEDDKLNEALVKDLTGGEIVTARKMKQDYWSFKPTHKIWFPGNHRPEIRGTDVGIWRRMRLVPWDLSLTEEQKDHRLTDRLKEELPGILMWAYEGFRHWFAQGMPVPSTITQAVNVYRNESDSLTLFLDTRCEIAISNASPLWETKIGFRSSYEKFCKDNRMAQAHDRRISEALQSRGVVTFRVREGEINHWSWKGLKVLRDAERFAPEAVPSAPGIGLQSVPH